MIDLNINGTVMCISDSAINRLIETIGETCGEVVPVYQLNDTESAKKALAEAYPGLNIESYPAFYDDRMYTTSDTSKARRDNYGHLIVIGWKNRR